MSFVTKEWKDRLAEFAGRRKLTNVSTGEETTVDVSRAEGEVSQAGDAFSAANMNDLEQRIKDGFDKVDTNLGNIYTLDYDNKEVLTLPAEFTPKKNGVLLIRFYNASDVNGMLSVTQGGIETIAQSYSGYWVSITKPVNANMKVSFTYDRVSASTSNIIFVPYK